MGELAALKMFCSALIAAHPDPVALQKLTLAKTEQMTAGMLGHASVPDAAVNGIQDVSARLSADLQARLRRSSRP